MLSRTFLLTTALVILAGTARADEQLSGAGKPYWNHRQEFTNTTACVTEEGSARCALFPAGTSRFHKSRVVVAEFDGATGGLSCSFVGQVTSVTLAYSAISDANGGASAPEFGAGPGAGVSLRVTSVIIRKDAQLDRVLAIKASAIGTSRGLCSTPVVSAGDELHAPCRIDDDCNDYGNGSCVTNPDSGARLFAGMKLICEADAAGTFVGWFSKEVVPIFDGDSV